MAARKEWSGRVASFDPVVRSLDWTFMSRLPPQTLADTYAWYQFLLNLQAAELFERHGVEFLQTLDTELSWDTADDWTTESVLDELGDLAPQFVEWARGLDEGELPQR
jgi:hypothetical protein